MAEYIFVATCIRDHKFAVGDFENHRHPRDRQDEPLCPICLAEEISSLQRLDSENSDYVNSTPVRLLVNFASHSCVRAAREGKTEESRLWAARATAVSDMLKILIENNGA